MSSLDDLSKTDAIHAARIVEALVFASAKAIPIKSVLPFLQDEAQLPEIIELIRSRYDERSGLSFEVSGASLPFERKLILLAIYPWISLFRNPCLVQRWKFWQLLLIINP